MRYTFPYLSINKKESHADIFSPKYSKDAKGSPKLVATPESGASECAWRNGFRHVDGGWMWDDTDVQLPVRVAGSSDEYLETKISRELLRKRSQSGGQKGPVQTSRDRRGRSVCGSVARGAQTLARAQNPGAGPGCQRTHGSLYRAVDQRGVSRVWDTRSLDDAGRPSRGGMATALGTDAHAAGRGGASRGEGAGEGRPRVFLRPGVGRGSVRGKEEDSGVGGSLRKKK